MLRHLAGRSSEDRHELTLARSAFGRSRCAGLPKAMGSTGALCSTAGVPKPIAEAFLHPRSPFGRDEICQVPGFGRGDRGRKRLKDRDRDQLTGLALPMFFGADRDHAVSYMLLADAQGITAPQSGVEQKIEGQPLARADRPARFEAVQFLLRPSVEAVFVVRPGEQFNAVRRIDRDVIFLNCPGKEPAHGLEEGVRGMRCCRSALAASTDGFARDIAQRFVAGCLDQLLKDVFPRAARGGRKRSPCRAIPVAVDRPFERVVLAGC